VSPERETEIGRLVRERDRILDLVERIRTPEQVERVDRLLRRSVAESVDWIEKNAEVVEM
jgi:hypothetical protein